MVDIEQLLAQGQTIKIKPIGYSMYPLFIPGRDEAVIAPCDPGSLRRGDVILYRRDRSILVLHRIWKHKAGELYLVGDNQSEIEGPLREDQVRGKLIAVVRRGRMFSVDNILYRCLFGIWLFLRPLRPVIAHSVAAVKKWLRKLLKR